MEKQTQEKAILTVLKKGMPITPFQALNLCGCFRLSARIWDLRKKGWNITTIRRSPYAVYKLKQND